MKKNILLQYKTKYHQQMKLRLFCWQQNQNFLMRSQDIYSHVFGNIIVIFLMRSQDVSTEFVATKLDIFDKNKRL